MLRKNKSGIIISYENINGCCTSQMRNHKILRHVKYTSNLLYDIRKIVQKLVNSDESDMYRYKDKINLTSNELYQLCKEIFKNASVFYDFCGCECYSCYLFIRGKEYEGSDLCYNADYDLKKLCNKILECRKEKENLSK